MARYEMAAMASHYHTGTRECFWNADGSTVTVKEMWKAVKAREKAARLARKLKIEVAP